MSPYSAVLRLISCSAIYGFTIGSSHSWLYASRNLAKFPLLILTTGLVCAVAYYVAARFVTSALTFSDVARLVVEVFHDAAVLLASLSPASFFLAMTMQQPTSRSDLGGYPAFQGLNVGLIAVCGLVAVVRQTRALLTRHSLSRASAHAVILGWLGLSLFAGSQCAWYMRPFFGVSSLRGPTPPFFLGSTPDFRGARSFFEAVCNLVVPPGSG